MYTALLVALAGASLVSAAPIDNSKRYKASILEDYDAYHLRYVALNCRVQHNTTFFHECCHPLRKGENATVALGPQCVPNATALASASAHIANATAPLPTATGQAAGGSNDWTYGDHGDGYSNGGNHGGDKGGDDKAPAGDDKAPPADDGAAAAYSSDGGDVPSTVAPAGQTDAPTTTPAPSSSPAPTPDVQNDAADAKAQDQPQEPSSSSSEDGPSSSSEQAPSSTSSSEQPSETPTNDNNGDNNKGNDNNGGGGGGDVNKGGQATFYAQTDGGLTGACGDVHSDSELVVALSTHGPWYPNPSERSPYCGRQVRIWPAGKFAGQGNTITATVVDACPSCTHNGNDLDLSHGAYDALGISRDVGVVAIEWSFV